jgi:hypothetical protein
VTTSTVQPIRRSSVTVRDSAVATPFTCGSQASVTIMMRCGRSVAGFTREFNHAGTAPPTTVGCGRDRCAWNGQVAATIPPAPSGGQPPMVPMLRSVCA